MKIYKVVTADHELEVDISLEDITNAIMSEQAGTRAYATLVGINNIGRFLKAIPDSVIKEFNIPQRELIAEFLKEQQQRFLNV